MKDIITKVGLIIMAISTMITMSACSKINNEIANDVCKALQKKYGETFAAIKIGDRFNTNYAKLYVYPTANEEILFTAVINKNTKEVEDTYAEEKVNYQVEMAIKHAFAEKKITVTSRCMVVTKEPIVPKDSDFTPKGYQEEHGFDHYTVYLIMKKENVSSTNILEAIKCAQSVIGVKLVAVCYVFEEDHYALCADAMEQTPDISITVIESMSPVETFDLVVNHEWCSLTENELQERLGRA